MAWHSVQMAQMKPDVVSDDIFWNVFVIDTKFVHCTVKTILLAASKSMAILDYWVVATFMSPTNFFGYQCQYFFPSDKSCFELHVPFLHL